MHKLSPFWSRNNRVKPAKKTRIGFADSADPRVLQATRLLAKMPHIQPFLLGSLESSLQETEKVGLAQLLMEKQSKFKVNLEEAKEQLKDPLYQGIALLLAGKLDGLVAGASRPTSDVVKAALHVIGPKKGEKLISGQFLMETMNKQTENKTPFLFADCAVVPEPSPRALATIAKGAADSYHFFTGKPAKVAFLSFSTRGSAEHPLVERIRKAKDLFEKQNPDVIVDGEIQADAAIDLDVARIKKAGDSPLKGEANVFIFPTLESGNIGYKLIQRFSDARIAGPLLWGLKKPVSDLSRGCTVQEIVDTAECVYDMIIGLN